MRTHKTNCIATSYMKSPTALQQFQNHQKALAMAQVGKTKPNRVTSARYNVKGSVKPLATPQRMSGFGKVSHANQQSSSYASQQIANKQNGSKFLVTSPLRPKSAPMEPLTRLEVFQQKQHQRELYHLNQRIKNCKSRGQRKKDNTDPFAAPVYLRRHDRGQDGLVGLEKKVVGVVGPKIAKVVEKWEQLKPTHGSVRPASGKSAKVMTGVQPSYLKATMSSPKPNFSGGAPSSKNPKKSNSNPTPLHPLPFAPNFTDIIGHIMENKIFTDEALKVLYVRLCYQFGEDRVDAVWGDVMKEMES